MGCFCRKCLTGWGLWLKWGKWLGLEKFCKKGENFQKKACKRLGQVYNEDVNIALFFFNRVSW